MADLLTPLRDHLVTQGIVRRPREATPVAPPLWLEPRDGVPAPGEGQNTVEKGSDAVLGAFRTTGIAPRRHEGFIRLDAIDIWLRTTSPKRAFDIHDQLRLALNDKRHWMMSTLLIEESLLFRDLQRIAATRDAFTFTTEFTFERWSAPEGVPSQ